MRSLDAAAVFTGLGVLIAWFVLNAVLQTSSRITWSFARDNALTFSKHLVKIHPKAEVPIYAILLNYVILVICGCIFLASKTGKHPGPSDSASTLRETDKNGNTAFNAILSSCVVLQQISFIMPAALLLYRRRSLTYLPDKRAFRLPGIVGWAANISVVVFGLIFTIVFCIPPFRPVTPSTMSESFPLILHALLEVFGRKYSVADTLVIIDYSSVMIGIAFVLVLINWFVHGKKHYHGPRIEFHGPTHLVPN